MGTLRYGHSGVELLFDDRTLLHLRAAITMKLRRNESFSLSYTRHVKAGSGRRSIWIHPAVPIRFTIDSMAVAGPLDRDWVNALVDTGNGGEMTLIDDPRVAHPTPPPAEPPSRSTYS